MTTINLGTLAAPVRKSTPASKASPSDNYDLADLKSGWVANAVTECEGKIDAIRVALDSCRDACTLAMSDDPTDHDTASQLYREGKTALTALLAI